MIHCTLSINSCSRAGIKTFHRTILFSLFFLFASTCRISAQTALSWAAGIGGPGNQLDGGMAYDGSGNLYLTGSFENTADFDPGPGVANLVSEGYADIFILKLDVSGNLVYAKRIGSTQRETGSHIAVDGSGNVYVTGSFQGTVDFDPGAGTTTLTTRGDRDIFILKLNANGDFVYAKKAGGYNYDDYGFGIAFDAADNVYLTGIFINTVDFDPGPATYNLTSAGSFDVFVLKLDGAGNFVYAKNVGGSGSDNCSNVTVDALGNVFLAGMFNGTADFDPGPGTVNLTSNGSTDAFILKLDGSGNYVYVTQIGATLADAGNKIVLDASGNLFVTGYFQGTVDFDAGAGVAELTSNGDRDAFILKLDASGNYINAKSFGSTLADYPVDVVMDAAGNTYISGVYSGTVDFDPGPGIANITSAGREDGFLLKLDASGNYVYAGSIGGTSIDNALHLAIDATNNVYLSGIFQFTADVDPGAGTYNLTSAAAIDIFVIALSQSVTGQARLAALNAPMVETSNNKVTPHIYPVPARDVITINTVGMNANKLKILLYNGFGQLVLQQKITAGGTHAVNISGFAKGSYLLQLSGENGYTSSHNIIVQ